ncbi:p-loop containing nucleoside triphosphate hydrolase protein [Mycena chlorophos]|uniref:p-loop containing nucleoside triphosphate hydrolase protein n=1 Tax=Mycena chlorophos TaxID=658473 RepID=A0A8H6TCZ0_MYCCL|nr:p-loop containing nucleoside triphosphate hydrolase protein [Mycena chlorophos]
MQALALHLVLRHLVAEKHASMLWIDTTGDFSVPRASEVLEEMTADEAEVLSTLDRLQIAQAFDVDTVFQVLESVQTSSNMPSNTPAVRAIVIDSITAILSPLLSPVSAQGHAIMSALMRQLHTLAQAVGTTIIVLNGSAAVDPSKPKIRKPALGPSFTFMTDATLWLAAPPMTTRHHQQQQHAAAEDDASRRSLHLYRTKISPRRPALTGSFDSWSSSLPLTKTASGFTGSTKIEFGSKITFKYIVDSNWVCSTTTETEADDSGNVNNVYQAPPKPVPTRPASRLSQLAADLVDTVSARDGTHSVLGYVASGLGAAMQATIGVDPINHTAEPYESPAPTKSEFTIEETITAPTETAAPAPVIAAPTPMAPTVPIAIVPVYAELEAATTGSSAPAASEPVPAASQAETGPSTHKQLPATIPSPTPAPAAVEEATTPLTVPEIEIIASTPLEGEFAIAEVAVPTLEPVVEAETTNGHVVEAPVEPAPVVEPTVEEAKPVAEEVLAAINGAVVEPPAVVEKPVEAAPEATNGSAVETPAVEAQPVSSAEVKAEEPKPAEVEATPVAATVVETPAVEAPKVEESAPVAAATVAAPAPVEPSPAPSTPSKSATPASTPATTPAASSTPAKASSQAFPSTESGSSTPANSPSRMGTTASRKKRQSIFGKLKHIFSDKDKEEKASKEK